jgi:hypothetical protein
MNSFELLYKIVKTQPNPNIENVMKRFICPLSPDTGQRDVNDKNKLFN